MTLYKLTDEHAQTLGPTQWGPGIQHSANGQGPLCGPGWIHAYEDLLVAVLMNPIHGGFSRPRGWEAEGDVGLRDGPLKCGCSRLKIIREFTLPTLTLLQCVRVAILVAILAVGQKVIQLRWRRWADRWLSGEDRSSLAARRVFWEGDGHAAGIAAAQWSAAEEGAVAGALLATSGAASAAAWAAVLQACGQESWEARAAAARTAGWAYCAMVVWREDFDLAGIIRQAIAEESDLRPCKQPATAAKMGKGAT